MLDNTTDSSKLTVSDNDHNTLEYARVTLLNRPDQPQEILSVNTTGANITNSYDPLTGVLWLNGTDSLTIYQDVLHTVGYENRKAMPGFPDTAPRRVQFVLFDGRHQSKAATSLITFESVNDAPIVDLNTRDPTTPNFTTVFTEEAGAVSAVDTLSTIEDIDSLILTNLTVRIVNFLDPNDETLALTSSNPALNSDFNSTSGVLSVSGLASPSTYQDALRLIVYNNAADEPVFVSRLVEVIAFDGDEYSSPVFSTINMRPVNDPPRLTLSDTPSEIFETLFTEDGLPVNLVDNASLSVVDDDDETLSLLTVELLQEEDVGYESVFFDGNLLPSSFSQPDDVLVACPTFGRGKTVLRVDLNYTLLEWQILLGSLKYCDSDQHPVSGVRMINITLFDSSGASTGPKQARVTVQHVNDPPFFIPQNATFVRFLNEDENVSVSVLHTFADHEETLTGSAIRIVQQPEKGVVKVDTPTGDLLFYPKFNDIGSRSVLYKACDSEGNCSQAQNLTFVIHAINDPPQPVYPLTLEVDEDSEVVVDLSRYFSDAEDDLIPNNIYPMIRNQLTATPRKGSWDLSPNLRNFTFRPSLNDYGQDELNFTVCDSVQACTDFHITIIIHPVNDIPTAEVIYLPQLTTIRTTEDTPVQIEIRVEDQEDRSELNVTVDTVRHGTASPDRSRLTTLVIGDRNVFRQTMHILFSPEKDYYGDAWLVFTAKDKDNGSVSVRVNITILPENDPPTFGSVQLFTQEDQVLSVRLPQALSATDKEDTLRGDSITLLSNTTIGVVTYDNGAPQSNQGVLTYTPPLNFFSTPSRAVTFSLRVCDIDVVRPLCTDSVITINVTSVNDVPPAPEVRQTVNEEDAITFSLHQFLTDVEDGKPPISGVTLDLSVTRKGTATYNSQTGEVTYQTKTGAFGEDVVQYTVCDSEGACNSSGVILMTISPFNDAPVATNFVHTTKEDDFDLVSIYNRVSDNDTASTRDALLAVLKISLINSTGGYVSRLTSPRGGELRVYQGHGIITYEAPNNYVGPDSFRYSVCDRCDPRRNFELGRLQVTDPACVRQYEANGRSYLQTNSHVYITCAEGRVDVLVGNVNDVPTVLDIAAVTNQNQPIVLAPLSQSVDSDGKFSNSTKPVYDRDDHQANIAKANGINLIQYNLSSTTDINITRLNILAPGPTKGTVISRISSEGMAEFLYTPSQATSGYDSFEFEVCDKSIALVKAATCSKAKARVLINKIGPTITKIVADGSTGGGSSDTDSKFSRGDTIRIYFDQPTNTPPRGVSIGTTFPTEEVDQLLTFAAPFISPQRVANRYQGKWLNTTLLEIEIIDEGYPQPNVSINHWRLGVKENVQPCNGFDPATNQILLDNQLNRYCLLTADGHSLHASTTSPPLEGDFGEKLPIVTNVIYRSTGVEDTVIIGAGGTYFGANSELLLFLDPPLSQPQLEEYCNYPAEEILTYKATNALGAETDLDVSGCANLLSNGQNAEVFYMSPPYPSAAPIPRLAENSRRRRATEEVEKTNMPVISQIIFRVNTISSSVSPSNSEDFIQRITRSLSTDTLRKVIFRDRTSGGFQPQPIYKVGIFEERRSDNTPTVLSFEASDPDNADSVFGVEDTLTITFDRDTDQPQVLTKADIDKIMTFKTPLGTSYTGLWTSPRILVITVVTIDETAVKPAVGSFTFTFKPNFLDGERNLTANNIYLPTSKPNCVGVNVCGRGSGTPDTVGVCASGSASCRAAGESPVLTGSFGTGTGVSSTQSLWWIAIIVVLLLVVVGLIAYFFYRHHKQASFRKEAMRWVRRWQSDKTAPGKEKPEPRSPAGGPSDTWNRPPSIAGMRPVPDPFSNLPEVTTPEPVGPDTTFFPRQAASIDDADATRIPPTASFRRPVSVWSSLCNLLVNQQLEA